MSFKFKNSTFEFEINLDYKYIVLLLAVLLK